MLASLLPHSVGSNINSSEESLHISVHPSLCPTGNYPRPPHYGGAPTASYSGPGPGPANSMGDERKQPHARPGALRPFRPQPGPRGSRGATLPWCRQPHGPYVPWHASAGGPGHGAPRTQRHAQALRDGPPCCSRGQLCLLLFPV